MTLTKRGLNYPCNIICSWIVLNITTHKNDKVIITLQCFTLSDVFEFWATDFVQHKQCNNLPVPGKKDIKLLCKLGLQIEIWSQTWNFTFSRVIQISRGFLILAFFEENLLKSHAKFPWREPHLYCAPAACWLAKLPAKLTDWLTITSQILYWPLPPA